MTEEEIKKQIEIQRNYFYTGATLPVKGRIEVLKKLKEYIVGHEKEIHDALHEDLGKSSFESYMCETGLALSELTHMIQHIEEYAEEQDVHTPISQFAARSYKKPVPYGVVLIMSPWNYPFLLSLDPLIDALAAGNTVILKPSAYSPSTTAMIETLVRDCFEPELVSVVTGGREENTCLLNQHFDYIFFTGSQNVGKEVMAKASQLLTPVTLELGGKSPCIVDRKCNLKLAARRIVFGKFLNCGQTCVAPDYIYCDRKIKDRLVKHLIRQIRRQYSETPLQNPNYGKIINEKHFDRLCGYIDQRHTVVGGEWSRKSGKIEPTILTRVSWDSPVMQEEIFGPILPVLVYEDLDEAIAQINSQPKPLALYLFTRSRRTEKKVLGQISYGGGCVNDTVVHLATSHMPFGGVGESGMGSDHGKAGFDTFTHRKSILKKALWLDLPVRYPPYKGHLRLLKKLM